MQNEKSLVWTAIEKKNQLINITYDTLMRFLDYIRCLQANNLNLKT